MAYAEHPIRETPPKKSELQTMLKAYDGELKRLFNTSGGDYREQKLGPKLAENGNLVKRPFVLGEGVALVGFSESVWQERLSA